MPKKKAMRVDVAANKIFKTFTKASMSHARHRRKAIEDALDWIEKTYPGDSPQAFFKRRDVVERVGEKLQDAQQKALRMYDSAREYEHGYMDALTKRAINQVLSASENTYNRLSDVYIDWRDDSYSRTDGREGLPQGFHWFGDEPTMM